MPVLSMLMASAVALVLAQAPVPRVEQVDLMSPAPQQQQAPARPAAPVPERQTATPPPETAGGAKVPEPAQPAAVPLRSEATSSNQRIAAFWFTLPGGDS